jgi:NAD-dependent deacetylase sirtuin 4
MRINIPNITINAAYTPTLLPAAQTIQRLVEFLGASTGTAVLTGAGVSVDSGIRAYRGDHGRYINPNYK